MSSIPLISFITPLHNAVRTITLALDSIARQTHPHVEACLYDDCSTDGSVDAVRAWVARGAGASPARPSGVPVRLLTAAQLLGSSRARPLGPAFARNRAAAQSAGAFLCWLDADDEALPRRAELQLAAARAAPPGALIGTGFVREPKDATPRYTAWANSLSGRALVEQSWRECTLLQPTWFMSSASFKALGGYDEAPPEAWCGGEGAIAAPSLELAPAEAGGAQAQAQAQALPPPLPPPRGEQQGGAALLLARPPPHPFPSPPQAAASPFAPLPLPI